VKRLNTFGDTPVRPGALTILGVAAMAWTGWKKNLDWLRPS